MWMEGYCFMAGMGAVLVVLPVLGVWGGYRHRERRRPPKPGGQGHKVREGGAVPDKH